MKEFFTRRIGPAPVWLYFVIFVIGLVILLRWRQSHAASSVNSDAASSPNLTDAVPLTVPYVSDIFVNVQQPGAPGPPGPAGPTGPVGTPAPPPRSTSITYKVVSGDTLSKIANRYHTTAAAIYAANKSLIEATARQHGFTSSGGGHWIFPSEKLVIPA